MLHHWFNCLDLGGGGLWIVHGQRQGCRDRAGDFVLFLFYNLCYE